MCSREQMVVGVESCGIWMKLVSEEEKVSQVQPKPKSIKR